MTMQGIKRKIPVLEVLTEAEVEAIHRATLQVLWETGVTFHHAEALDIFEDAGCQVDRSNNRVRFPNWLVEQCLATCPNSFRVKARNPKNDIILAGGGDTTYSMIGCAMSSLDLDTWAPQAATRKEFYDYMRLVDALPYAHIMSAFPMFGFAGTPECMQLLESNASKLRVSSKTQQEGGVLDNHLWNIKMAQAVGADCMQLINPAAPLTYYENIGQMILDCCELDAPFHTASGPVAGATAPATLAGALVNNNAEGMAGIILAQLVKPGHRVWTGNMMMVQNMRTGSPSFGAVENVLGEAMFNQVWRRYQIPTWISSCAWCDSKVIDYQAGWEQTMALTFGLLSGPSAMFYLGSLTAELTGHPYKSIMDNDILGQAARFLAGATVNEETLAVDLINQVGPIPGYFLNLPHTREWWKKEQFLTKTADQDSYEIWVGKGKKTALDHAEEVAQKILATHKGDPLTAEQEAAVEKILQEARGAYRAQGQISDADWEAYMKVIESPTYPFA